MYTHTYTYTHGYAGKRAHIYTSPASARVSMSRAAYVVQLHAVVEVVGAVLDATMRYLHVTPTMACMQHADRCEKKKSPGHSTLARATL